MWTIDMMNTFLMILGIIVGVLILAVLCYLFLLVRPRGRMPENKNLLCAYAHRGLHGRGVPENSLEAFRLACEEGLGMELDLQLSKDGKVMVFHDYNLKRMTGVDKLLCELNADELQTLSLAGTAQTIPTFEQVLALVDGKTPLLVELKGENLDTSLCEKTAELLRNYKGEYCIESFNPMLIRKIKKYLPDVFCGQLYTNVCRDKNKKTLPNIVLTSMALNCFARPDFIAYNKSDREMLPVKLTTKFYRAPKFVWTLRSEDEVATANSLGECPIFERA